jgi:PAS domain S-box-containing protein
MKIDQKASDSADNRSAFLNDEVYYKDIVEGKAELICRFNSDNNLIFVNDAFCNYFHLIKKDLTGQGFLEVVPEKDGDFFQSLLSSLDRKNPVATADNHVTLPNRDELWQQWTIRAIFDDKGIIVE